jgi:hypothetical protein
MKGIKLATLVACGLTVAFVTLQALTALRTGSRGAGVSMLEDALHFAPGMGIVVEVMLVAGFRPAVSTAGLPDLRPQRRRLPAIALFTGVAAYALAWWLEGPVTGLNLTQFSHDLIRPAFVEQTMCGYALGGILWVSQRTIDMFDAVKYAVLVAVGFAVAEAIGLHAGGWLNWLAVGEVHCYAMTMALTMTALGIAAATTARSIGLRVIAVTGGWLAAIAINALFDYGLAVPAHLGLTNAAQFAVIVAWAAGAYAIAGRDRLVIWLV